jgi:AraC-like DNA-binding protein
VTHYSCTRPNGALGQFVRAIWCLEDDTVAADPQPIIPDGCPEIVFNLGDPIVRHCDGARAVHVDELLVGQQTRSVLVAPQGRVRLVGIRLHPWALRSLFGISAAETRDRIEPLENVLTGELRRKLEAARDRSSPAKDVADRISGTLASHAAHRAAPASTTADATRMAETSVEPLSVKSIARALGRSERNVQRIFADDIGLSPKSYLRILRVQRALRCSSENPDASWARIAAVSGFYDQPHLIREFQRFAGTTPAALDAAAGEITRRLGSERDS